MSRASKKTICLSIMLLMAFAMQAANNERTRVLTDTLVLNRVFRYPARNPADMNGVAINIYQRFHLRTEKKNTLLLTVPSMYVLARKKNTEYVGETYTKIRFTELQEYEENVQLRVGTVPRFKNTMPTIRPLMMPKLYDVTITKDHLLSPFHQRNEILYRYGVSLLTDNRVEIVFRPRKYNTQLISGRAVADYATGRILSVEFTGEYDMVSFHVEAEMGQSDTLTMIPQKCDADVTFKYLGNKINCKLHTVCDQATGLPDSIVDSHDRALLDSIRPEPLPSSLQTVYDQYDSIEAVRSLTPQTTRKKNFAEKILWDAVGDNLVNRIRGHFGSNDQGYFRISPILNPLYMGYSERKGLYHKMKVNLSYAFTPNQILQLNARFGYLFKHHQFYFNIPVRYTFNAERNGFLEVQVGNGNRINSSSIRKQLMEDYPTLTDWEKNNERLDYFTDTYLKLLTNYNLTPKWSMALGATFHRRSAVDKTFFRSINMPLTYHSFAPMVQTQVLPWGNEGPVLTLCYEQGVKGVGKANMEYGRTEFDASWLKRLYRMKSLSMRIGAGCYVLRDEAAYFLDYENFREDNIRGGWNDDWSGEFQLLRRDSYNSSRYYVRSNLTYESPLMLMSRLPLVGKAIEMERVYVSGLLVDKLHPYMEYGYGFTNRIFSIGVFVATENFKYDGIGCRIGLELFSDW